MVNGVSHRGVHGVGFNLSAYREASPADDWANRARVVPPAEWPASGREKCALHLALPELRLSDSLHLFRR